MIEHSKKISMTYEEAYKKGQMDSVDLMTRLLKNLGIEFQEGINKMKDDFFESIKDISESERKLIEEAWKNGSLDMMKGISKTMALDALIKKE